VRQDLPLGFLAAQVTHAAGESSPGGLKPGTNAVVLAVRSEAELAALDRRLAQEGVEHVTICEPDPPWNGALTALGLPPTADRGRLRPFLSSLPLLGKEVAP
jgi:peptidyl-tRNA hydrolase